jgi:hypothetical protein
MAAKITFNGQEYNSPDEMPPQVRQLYERAITSLEQKQPGAASSPKLNIKVTTNLRFKYNGQVYNSLDELPADVRPRYEKLVSQMDKDHDGVPDFLEGKASQPENASFNMNTGETFGPSAPIVPLTQTQSATAPDQSAKRMLVIAGAVIVLLLFALVILIGYIYFH